MKRIVDHMAKVHMAIMILLYIIVIATVFAQVIYRYGLKIGLPWSADLALGAFMWLVFLATAHGVRDRSHFSVNILPSKLPVPAELAVRTAVAAAMLAALCILLIHGSAFTLDSIATFSAALGISRAWIIASIPVSAGIALVYWVAGVRDFVRIDGEPDAD